MERTNHLTLGALNHYLISHQIQTSAWGTGESKTLTHLLNEIITGESVLIESSDGKLIRMVTGVGINVYYKPRQELLKLKEDRQVFVDGRVRRRDLITSIGEKIRLGETPEQAATRTFEEELQIFRYNFSNFKTVDREFRSSTSYPGLYSKGTVFVFDRFLDDKDFRQEGYIEVQNDKTSYFVWEPTTETPIDKNSPIA